MQNCEDGDSRHLSMMRTWRMTTTLMTGLVVPLLFSVMLP